MLKLLRIDNARMNVPEPEYFKAGDEYIDAGKIVNFKSDGRVYQTKGKDPAMGYSMSEAYPDQKIAICRFSPDQVWEAETWNNMKDGSAVYNGGHVAFISEKINEGGDHAVVVDASDYSFDGTTSRGKVKVRFLCN